MPPSTKYLTASITAGIALFSSLLLTAAPLPRGSAAAAQSLWAKARLITPAALASELREGKKPVIVCVGFSFLYEAAHIPRALLEGPASEAAGLAKFKQWAQSQPKDTPVIIYCGCCPFAECPNIRPAYFALLHAGLTRVQVLDLRHNFATDWVQKGYPTERSK